MCTYNIKSSVFKTGFSQTSQLLFMFHRNEKVFVYFDMLLDDNNI